MCKLVMKTPLPMLPFSCEYKMCSLGPRPHPLTQEQDLVTQARIFRLAPELVVTKASILPAMAASPLVWVCVTRRFSSWRGLRLDIRRYDIHLLWSTRLGVEDYLRWISIQWGPWPDPRLCVSRPNSCRTTSVCLSGNSVLTSFPCRVEKLNKCTF